jgi:hypothetical protein
MKTISNIALAIILLCISATAQAQDVGFLRIVHAVAPGEGNASFLLNGLDLHPAGYRLGQDTGGYAVKAGDLRIVVRKEGVTSGTTRIHLNAGETTTLIAFAERLPDKNPDTPPRWKIKFMQLSRQHAESGYGLSFVSVCTRVETVVDVALENRKRTEQVSARRLAITRLDAGRKAVEIGVFMSDRKLTHISTDSPGNYVVILYEDAEGLVRALSFYDPKFVVAG